VDEQIQIRRASKVPIGAPVLLAESEALRTEALHIQTTSPNEFWDLTDTVRAVVARSRVRHGQVTIYSPHTTTTVLINES